jgi:LPPG:FO 2-phospho-L-lactate transferase
MADACLEAIGVETSARAVGEHYGSRANGGLIDAWLVDVADSEAVAGVSAAGIACRAIDTMMTDVEATAKIAAECLAMADEVRASR